MLTWIDITASEFIQIYQIAPTESNNESVFIVHLLYIVYQEFRVYERGFRPAVSSDRNLTFT